MQDAITIVQKYGKLDLFITFTYNPKWAEVQQELPLGVSAEDRPNILA